jgi:cob(I)alamin adenosyltransferase
VRFKAQRYRQLAAECMKIANDAKEEHHRLALVHMARTWLRLAELKRDD